MTDKQIDMAIGAIIHMVVAMDFPDEVTDALNATVGHLASLDDDPEQQWMPYPDTEPPTDHVLVTCKWSDYDYEVFELDYGVAEYAAKERNDKHSADILEHMIAWMLKPEPYKGEET